MECWSDGTSSRYSITPLLQSAMNPILRPVMGALIGAAVGYAMYRFVGCKSGACPLTANPWVAMAIWGLMGLMLSSGK